MSSPLIDALTGTHGYPLVDGETVDGFIESHENTLLFFTENPKQFPESNDVAVVLPELMKQFGGRIQVAVVDRSVEKQLHAHFPFSGWPALVHLRRGKYVGAISRMQDWDVYLQELNRLLAREPVTTQAFCIPVVSENQSHCH